MPHYETESVRICVLIMLWTCIGPHGGAIRWRASTATRGRRGGSSSPGCRATAAQRRLSGSMGRVTWWCTARRRAAGRPGTRLGTSGALAGEAADVRDSFRSVWRGPASAAAGPAGPAAGARRRTRGPRTPAASARARPTNHRSNAATGYLCPVFARVRVKLGQSQAWPMPSRGIALIRWVHTGG
jgi:hypothetical protein